MDFIQKHINSIVNADCLDFMKQMPDKCVDLLLTDPPYGMNYRSNKRKYKHNLIINDDNLSWLPEWCKEIDRIIKPDAHLYIFCSWHNIEVFKNELSVYFPIKNILIWMKNNRGMGDLKGDYAPQYEMIIFANPKNKALLHGRDSNILKFARTQNALHPTEKPVDLFEKLIIKSTNDNELVLDPFSGSGTTAIACRKLNRRFICVEKDLNYFQAFARWLENEQKQLMMAGL